GVQGTPRSASWRLLIKVLRVNSRRDPPDLPRRHGRGLRPARFVGGVERLTRAPPSVKYGFYSNTFGANRVRAKISAARGAGQGPAQGANAPMHQSREAHRSAGRHSTPRAGQVFAR